MRTSLDKPCPAHERRCPTCGEAMTWLPLVNVFNVCYRWRAWCHEHGFAKRKAA